MDIQEFLRSDRRINASEIARLMWPDNKNAESYLNRKLKGERPFTEKDANKARSVLLSLGIDINALK